MNFYNFKIGVRLGSGFAVVLALTLMIGLFSIAKLALVNDATADIATNCFALVQGFAALVMVPK